MWVECYTQGVRRKQNKLAKEIIKSSKINEIENECAREKRLKFSFLK